MTGSLPRVRYDWRDYPPEQRFEVWRLALAATYDVEMVDPSVPFNGEIDGWMLGDLLLAHLRYPPLHFKRDEAKIKSENSDHYLFFHTVEGEGRTRFEGTDIVQSAGGTAVLDLRKPFESSRSRSNNISVSVPRVLLEKALRSTHSYHGTLLEGPLGRLLADHLVSTVAIAPELSIAEGVGAARTTVLLMASCLSASVASAKDEAPVMALAIRHDIQRHIERNMHRVELTPALICKELEVSRSAAYRAFEGTEGIAAHLRMRRLLVARTMLEHPAERRPIAEIASAVGYEDATLFSHAYRRAFGHAPRESRSAAGSAEITPIEVSSKVNHANFHRWVRDLDAHLSEKKG